jgi:glycosyltransferase involved in cell wall biosynthesis
MVEEPSTSPLVPILKTLLSLTRCRQLAVIDAEGRTTPFSRGDGVRTAGAIAGATVGGALAAAACDVDLRRLQRRPRTARTPAAVSRVAYLKTNLWFGVRAGGSVGHVAGVVNAMSRRGIHVDVFAVDPPPLVDRDVAVDTVENDAAYGYPYELNYYAYHRRFVRRVRAALAVHRPDVIYHRLSVCNYAGAALAETLGVPLVVEYNGSEVWVARHWGRPLRLEALARRAEDVSLERADLIVVVSHVLRDELVAKGIDEARILVHPNCIDPAMFDPSKYSEGDRAALRLRLGIPADAVVCGFIGTFGAWHGAVELAKAIARLVASDGDWVRRRRAHFLLVGDGQFMPDVRALLSPPEVAAHVTLTGLVPQQEAPAHLAICDVLLSPHVPNADGSRFFGSPTKLFEYMAMGRGIVASALDQIGEVLSPDASGEALAVLVTPGSVEELANGIRLLIDRPDLREMLGARARQRVLARYTWERNVDTMLRRLGSPQAVAGV